MGRFHIIKKYQQKKERKTKTIGWTTIGLTDSLNQGVGDGRALEKPGEKRGEEQNPSRVSHMADFYKPDTGSIAIERFQH